jgi:hypothetical protein
MVYAWYWCYVISSVLCNAFAAICKWFVIYLWLIHLVTRPARLSCYTHTFKGPNVKRCYMRWIMLYEMLMNDVIKDVNARAIFEDVSVKLNPCMLRYVRYEWLHWWLSAANGSMFWVLSGKPDQPPNVTSITIYSVDWFILSLTTIMDRRRANLIESGGYATNDVIWRDGDSCHN